MVMFIVKSFFKGVLIGAILMLGTCSVAYWHVHSKPQDPYAMYNVR